MTDPQTQVSHQQLARIRDNAIVVVSIGERPWIPQVRELAQFYADKTNADLVIVTEAPTSAEFPLDELPASPGRPNKRAYACKTFFAWKYLKQAGYRRVLVLDDTCCISVKAPDIFALSAPGTVLYTQTGKQDATKSFADIRAFIVKNDLPGITFDSDLYMNSGVLLYDQDTADAISPDKIVAASDLLFSHFPHQSLTYYLLRSADVTMKEVDRRFNRVPGVALDKEIRRDLDDITPHLNTEIFIQHVTGIYRKRDQIIGQICDILLAEWRGRQVDA